MRTLVIAAGIAGLLVLGVVAGALGFGIVSTAFAQGPTPGQNGFPGYAACHNSTAVLDLLKVSAADLLKERQAGKSLLEIAKTKEVDEAKLTDALLQPVSAMHAWMGQTYGNKTYADQMTQLMRDQIAKDIRESKIGTMTDMRLGLFGTTGQGSAGYGMMGGGYGMMGGWNGQTGLGMMGRWSNGTNSNGGMMGNWRR